MGGGEEEEEHDSFICEDGYLSGALSAQHGGGSSSSAWGRGRVRLALRPRTEDTTPAPRLLPTPLCCLPVQRMRVCGWRIWRETTCRSMGRRVSGLGLAVHGAKGGLGRLRKAATGVELLLMWQAGRMPHDAWHQHQT